MITDSLARQFLILHRDIIRISAIEDDLGITGKSIYHWIIGKRPLPSNWEIPLQEYLYPMLDVNNEVHQKMYKCDKVVVLDQSHIQPRFQMLGKHELRKIHFFPSFSSGADIIYYSFNNLRGRHGIITIYSAYF